MLSKYYHFSSKSDPFLLIPSQPSSNSGYTPKKKKNGRKKAPTAPKPKLIRLELDFGLVKKLKQLELILVEEAVSNFFVANNWTTNSTQEEAKLSIDHKPESIEKEEEDNKQ